MSLAFRFGRARVVRRPGKEMPALHASALRLPGRGTPGSRARSPALGHDGQRPPQWPPGQTRRGDHLVDTAPSQPPATHRPPAAQQKSCWASEWCPAPFWGSVLRGRCAPAQASRAPATGEGPRGPGGLRPAARSGGLRSRCVPGSPGDRWPVTGRAQVDRPWSCRVQGPAGDTSAGGV